MNTRTEHDIREFLRGLTQDGERCGDDTSHSDLVRWIKANADTATELLDKMRRGHGR